LKKIGPIAISVLKIEILIFAMLIASIAYLLVGKILFFAIEAVLAALYLYVLFFELRKRAENFRDYAIFFSGILVIAAAVVCLPAVKIEPMMRFQLSIGIIIVALVFIFAFRIFFGKKYAMGTVAMCKDGKAMVDFDFDINSFTTARQEMIECRGNYPAGKKVRVGIKSSIFGTKYTNILDN
jgi:uncharacterized membrane protein